MPTSKYRGGMETRERRHPPPKSVAWSSPTSSSGLLFWSWLVCAPHVLVHRPLPQNLHISIDIDIVLYYHWVLIACIC